MRAHGFYSDPLMRFENLAVNLDSVHNTRCFVRSFEGFEEIGLEIHGIVIGHR